LPLANATTDVVTQTANERTRWFLLQALEQAFVATVVSVLRREELQRKLAGFGRERVTGLRLGENAVGKRQEQ
jgi:hypothetical protein